MRKRYLHRGLLWELLLSSLAWLLAAAPLRAQAPPRLAPRLREAGSVKRQAVRLRVRDAAAFRAWAGRELPGVALAAAPGQAAVLELGALSPAQLARVAACPLVEFVDVPNRPAHDERLLGGADLTVNSLRAVQRRYPALTGRDLVVSIKENPLDPTDLDFRGRLLNTPASAVIATAHASIMATLIAGAGNSGPAGEGAARQAGLASSSYANLLPDANADLTSLGVSVQNHSYGTGIENYYGLEALGYDQQTQQLPTLLHVFSAGNSGSSASADGAYKGLLGWANLTGQFKMSKNSLSVGATDALGQVAPLSSRGPAYDGRVKPELVAYGDAGSSDASALVSGAALLVQQAYRDGQGGALPPAALVKAALLNSADDVGAPAVDFATGFGQLNALGAVRTMLEGRYRSGSVGPGQEQLFTLNVPAGTPQLKVTMAWTDPAAAANAAAALVNDLDLEVRGPGPADRWLPWTLSAYPHPDSLTQPARRRPDHRNNVEQVTLSLPGAGTYQVRVRGYAVATGSQAFSLAYEVVAPGFEWLAPSTGRNVQPGQPATLRWAWAGPAAPARLEYRPVGRAGWRPLAPSIDLTQRTYTWQVPDTTTLAQLRCVVGNQAIESDTFAIAAPPQVHIGYVCGGEALLSWPATPGATHYQVFTLGPTSPEPLQLVADTLLVLPAAQSARQYFAVAPVLGGRLLERSTTVNLAEAGVSCYIQSFLAQLPVTDTARLVLSLGTLYHLRAVQLQRLGPGGFQTVQTLSPVTQLTTLFTDLEAQPGLNQYRLLGQDAAGRTFSSDTVAVQLVRRGELLVFPVPARAGEALHVAGEPGQLLRLRLYDALGRLLREDTGSGALNELSTAGLQPGTYLLHVQAASGPAVVRRVLIL